VPFGYRRSLHSRGVILYSSANISQVPHRGVLLEIHQLDLFSGSQISSTPASRQEILLMDSDTLVKWKAQIVTYQQRARNNKPGQQVALFDLTPAHTDPDAIDPFRLRLCPMSFYRLPVDNSGGACIYFMVDSAANLILYIGETCRSNLRWKGVHDAKRYLSLYQDLHYRHGLKTAVNMVFWWDVPAQTKPRQQLELSLILRWRSPFNKENWTRWGAPFVG